MAEADGSLSIDRSVTLLLSRFRRRTDAASCDIRRSHQILLAEDSIIGAHIGSRPSLTAIDVVNSASGA
jgi:hypothetical protein